MKDSKYRTFRYKRYLINLMNAMRLTKDEVKEIEPQIKKDYNSIGKDFRIKEGEEILNSIK